MKVITDPALKAGKLITRTHILLTVRGNDCIVVKTKQKTEHESPTLTLVPRAVKRIRTRSNATKCIINLLFLIAVGFTTFLVT